MSRLLMVSLASLLLASSGVAAAQTAPPNERTIVDMIVIVWPITQAYEGYTTCMQLEDGLLQIEVTTLPSGSAIPPPMEFGFRRYMVSFEALQHNLIREMNRYTIEVGSGMYCYDLFNRAPIPANANIGDVQQNLQDVHLRIVWSPKQ